MIKNLKFPLARAYRPWHWSMYEEIFDSNCDDELHLTARGLTDSQIQLISGHRSKQSLEVYQHLSLHTVHDAYQEAAKFLGV